MLLALVQLATTIVLARLLVPADFGLVALAGAISAFLTLFADLGLSAATVQRKVLTQSLVSALFYVNLLAGLATMAVLMLIAPLAAIVFSDDRLLTIILVTSLTSPVLAASRQHAALLQRQMRWRAIQAIAVGPQLAASAAAVALALFAGWGYWALVAQSLLAAILTTLWSWRACSWRPGKVHDWQEAKEPLAFGFHLSVFGLVNAVHRQSDDMLIGWRWGAGELGQYSRAYALLKAPLQLINGPVGSAVMPMLSRLQDDPGRWRNTYLDALAFVALISSLAGAGLFACSEPLVALLYGPGWGSAGEILGYLALPMIFAGASNTSGWIFTSLGRSREMSRWAIFSTPVFLAGFLAGLPFGAKGVAIGYAVTSGLLTVPCLAYAARVGPIGTGAILRVAIPIIAIGLASGYGGKLTAGYFPGQPGALQIFVTSACVAAIFGALLLAYMAFDRELIGRVTDSIGKLQMRGG